MSIHIAVAPVTDSPVQTWTIDPSHTHVEFSVRHMMVSTVKGRFPAVSGTITLDDANLSRSTVDVDIAAASVNTHDEQRDAHLRSADFFDAEVFPTLAFPAPRSSRSARIAH